MKPQDRIGSLIGGRYRIVSLLGEGAMGAVYLANHEVLLRQFAVKVLQRHLANDPRIARRFQREARAASRVHHPNIVYISDFGTTDDHSLFLVMEYIRGHNLRFELRQKGPLPPARALPILVQLADALECAHQAGVVHRDLKPDNLILTEHRGRPDHLKILDFGMAKIVAPDARSELAITGQGEVHGTPEYMSPEQIEGREIGPASDIYSVGVVAYELVTGSPPFTGAPMEVMVAHCHTPLVAPSARSPQAALLPAFDAIIGKCLAKKPGNRYDTAGEVRVALTRLIRFAAGGSDADDGGDEAVESTRETRSPLTGLGFGDMVTRDGGMLGPEPKDAPNLFQRAVRDLAEGLRDHGLGSAELTLALAEAIEAEDNVIAAEAEVVLAEAQIEETHQTADEREARLRQAVMHLNQERARIVADPNKVALARTLRPPEKARPGDTRDTLDEDGGVSAIDSHVADLEQRMRRLDSERRRRLEEIEGRATAHRRAVEAWTKHLSDATMRLYELLQRTRQEVTQLELLSLYSRLDDLQPPH